MTPAMNSGAKTHCLLAFELSAVLSPSASNYITAVVPKLHRSELQSDISTTGCNHRAASVMGCCDNALFAHRGIVAWCSLHRKR